MQIRQVARTGTSWKFNVFPSNFYYVSNDIEHQFNLIYQLSNRVFLMVEINKKN